MEKDRLNYIIDNIQKTNAEDVQSLLSVVESYPYFTIAQTLLAVGMELNEDVKSGRQLKLAAAMVPDRNALRHLLIESREKMKSCDLPDEFSNQGEEEVIPEKTKKKGSFIKVESSISFHLVCIRLQGNYTRILRQCMATSQNEFHSAIRLWKFLIKHPRNMLVFRL